MLTVPAYAATSATGTLLAPTTVERRDVGPHDVLIDIKYCGICHSDIHNVRGEAGARRPTPWSPATRSPGHRHRGRFRGHPARGGDRVGVGCMVNSCRECVPCLRGEEQYCLKGNTLTYGSIDADGTLTQGGDLTMSWSTTTSSSPSPRASASTRPPRCCARASPRTPRCAAGRGPRQEGRGHRPGRTRSHGRQDRTRDGCRGHRPVAVAEEDGRRPAAGRRPLLRHQRPGHLRRAAGTFDVILNTVSAKLDLDTFLGLLAVGGTMVNVGAPGAAVAERVLADHAGPRVRGVADRRHPRRRRCSTSAPSTASGPRSRSSPPRRSARRTSGAPGLYVRYRFVIDTATLA